jgi:tetratricopeptide (TPR) repeat protein
LSRIRPEEAVARSREILEGKRRQPVLLFKAVELLFARAELSERTEPRAYENFLKCLNEGFAADRAGLESRAPKSVLSGAMVLAGLCWKRLGQEADAEREYSQAIEVCPKSPVPFVARGVLNYGRKTGDALSDFQEAIERDCPVVWPYFFLAHSSLLNSRFGDCIKYCQDGLKLAKEPAIAANLMHWRAVARFHAQSDKGELRNALSKAQEWAPDNRWIKADLESVDGIWGGKAIDSWNLPNTSDAKRIGEAHEKLGALDPVLA